MKKTMLAAIALALGALPALAEDAVPEFDTCIDIAAARFERELSWHRAGPFAERFGVGDVFHFHHCGELGAWHCAATPAPAACLAALVDRQNALRDAVLETLPAPETVAGLRGVWSDQLYPRMRVLAQGKSAGPDCAGLPQGEALRCEVREAALSLGIAARAWFLARYLGAAPDAITAGWAGLPPPTRPRAREDLE
ncbi:hypothetical protein M8756_02710 [Lutimaribacter sp. EGI FJ00015]|uniref:Uncharacterized protein n=1 Tax=Lutimaribacter degradans TaxID=2945989 RepID=A0ACC5ZRQ7_9RHOB|nr:hypothetical protein [Lutimaribacter sp. EGI FJ00013]MCM2560848.1 hypothetical protein [Lutimaribacter sp. EGI FJ00013]MCO0612207.1 hypothetical protein [Lutimaribacter sp. EGI FJ00015]MCO0634673.1 hypothetical protein [Lutimaribacter sp. EGI FJ00014]